MRASVAAILLILTAPFALGLEVALPVDDDAGSGRDAPDTPDPTFRMPLDVLVRGSMSPPLDDVDHYAFTTWGPTTIEVVYGPAPLCDVIILDDAGVEVPATCVLDARGALVRSASIDRAGTFYLVVEALASAYHLSLGIGSQPPDAIALGDDDAGSGRDAPEGFDPPFPDVPVTTGIVYQGSAVPPLLDGDLYTFDAPAAGAWEVRVWPDPLCDPHLFDSGGEALPSDCLITETGESVSTARIPAAGRYFVHVTLQAGAYAFSLGLDAEAPRVSPLAPAEPAPLDDITPTHPPRGSDPTCGTGAPVVDTAGAGGALDGFVYAALKTGFRAVVAWTTPEPSAMSLRYALDGGETLVLEETTERMHHVFVIDALPQGASLCFTPLASDGGEADAPRALRLANAMEAYEDGAYSINLLVVANEQPAQRELLERGMDGFAALVRDATDGHVQIGRVVVVYGDLDRHHSGRHSCDAAFFFTPARDTPSCDRTVDVVMSHDACEAASGCTYLDGIADPADTIMMNSVFEASPVLGRALWDEREVSSVLAHELGHYAFGAMDLYTTAGTGPDCWDPATEISIMASDRRATELDDEIHRCPNEAAIGDYVPSWTNLRERFPAVPERTSIDPGPQGAGAAYGLHTFAFTEEVPVPVPSFDDDAGSGRDAGEAPASSVPIEPDVTYDATALLLDVDVYAFEATAGETLRLFHARTAVCTSTFMDGNGEPIDGSCGLGEGGTIVEAVATTSGTMWVRMGPLEPVYSFQLTKHTL